MPAGVWILVAVVAAVVGYAVGRSGGASAGRAKGRAEGVAEGRADTEGRFRATARAVARGGLPEGAEPGSAEEELHDALRSGWAPREAEHQRALREALERVGAFLDQSVRAHLGGAPAGADADELRERIERALGAMSDLESFLQEPGEATEGRDLAQLVQQVTREFALDQAVSVRLSLDDHPVRAAVNAQSFMDALYLVLHNAGRFGGGSTVDVTVVGENGRALVHVRDRGKGFSEEALKRAFDPFYSTTADGLGLGLPHARKVVEAMGGQIELSNVPGGGADVVISFPGG
ncbi:MAG: HAMP domain-containing histidine kinase [Gemmatimonadetes bacterium]|nr:HAMP domain-containing histidine kinase [Gemmatimonadota bacterium]